MHLKCYINRLFCTSLRALKIKVILEIKIAREEINSMILNNTFTFKFINWLHPGFGLTHFDSSSLFRDKIWKRVEKILRHSFTYLVKSRVWKVSQCNSNQEIPSLLFFDTLTGKLLYCYPWITILCPFILTLKPWYIFPYRANWRPFRVRKTEKEEHHLWNWWMKNRHENANKQRVILLLLNFSRPFSPLPLSLLAQNMLFNGIEHTNYRRREFFLQVPEHYT